MKCRGREGAGRRAAGALTRVKICQIVEHAHFTRSMTQTWIPDWSGRSPAFEPLRRFAPALRSAVWPGLDELQRLLDDAGARTARGTPLSLVGQGPRPRNWEDRYEVRLYLNGELQVRPGSWHDFFNVLVWAAFPRAKAALNARHYRALLEQRAAGAPNRGPVQDALTLFDEGGVLVASSDRELLPMLEGFAWKELFWRNRARVNEHMHFVIFGHALYEKALEPFKGITGRGMLFEIGSGFQALAVDARVTHLDAMLAARLDNPRGLAATRELALVPILGVPGWHPENECESYYDDIGYFRPGRRGRFQSPL